MAICPTIACKPFFPTIDMTEKAYCIIQDIYCTVETISSIKMFFLDKGSNVKLCQWSTLSEQFMSKDQQNDGNQNILTEKNVMYL